MSCWDSPEAECVRRKITKSAAGSLIVTMSVM